MRPRTPAPLYSHYRSHRFPCKSTLVPLTKATRDSAAVAFPPLRATQTNLLRIFPGLQFDEVVSFPGHLLLVTMAATSDASSSDKSAMAVQTSELCAERWSSNDDGEHSAAGAYDSPPTCHLDQLKRELLVTAACLKNLQMWQRAVMYVTC